MAARLHSRAGDVINAKSGRAARCARSQIPIAAWMGVAGGGASSYPNQKFFSLTVTGSRTGRRGSTRARALAPEEFFSAFPMTKSARQLAEKSNPREVRYPTTGRRRGLRERALV